jgi:hypothetical protein
VALTAAFLLLMWLSLALAPAGYRLVGAPVAVCLTISLSFLILLWRWNRTLPIFELGAVFGLISLLYATVPALNFMSAGLSWTLLSDGRLTLFWPGPSEVARFTWPYAGFIAGYTVSYLLVRRRHLPRLAPVQKVRRSEIAVIVILFIAIQAVIAGIEAAFGINFDPSYLHGGLQEMDAYFRLPYFAQQVVHFVVSWRWPLKMLLVATAMQRWKSRVWRWLLIGFLGFELTMTLLRMGARTATALLLIVALILYHRFVKPITFKVAMVGACVLLGGFTLYGTIRTVGGSLQSAQELDSRIWTTSNDFQTLWASAYNIEYYLKTGLVPKPPWQAYLIDFVILIPSQLLPIAKVDPSTWFYTSIGATQSAMFGLRAQPVIGFGWVEFVLRGVFLGVLFALLHRWYVRNSSSFWKTMIYTYCLVWCHYIFRSTMLWPSYFVFYEIIPVMITVRVGATLLRKAGRRALGEAGA